MQLIWLTDIHLNFLYSEEREQFYQQMAGKCDALLISGDIAEANTIAPILKEMAHHIQKPIYFVLGPAQY